MDYGYYQDKIPNNKVNLITIELGIGLKIKNSLLKLALSNGRTKNHKIDFLDNNSKFILLCCFIIHYERKQFNKYFCNIKYTIC